MDLHRIHVKKVLSTIRQHRLYAKSEKSEYERLSILFLGLIISTDGICMDPQKVAAIINWPAPTDKKGIQRFVGFAKLYRRFVKKISTIISPITQLTQQHVQVKWSQEAQLAFDKLKTLFTFAPVL
ncbi:uncharacterized protein [Aquarana catesbeiana]|uniref:uncharacterized protein n=1 Tax=Aquarana catesbeiana TaxID=8400 RepID=UPI003CC9B7AD